MAFPVVQRLELVSAERLVVVPWAKPGAIPASRVQSATPVSPCRTASLSQRLRSLQVISACRRLRGTRKQNQEVTKHALASSKASPLSKVAFCKFSLYSIHHSVSQQTWRVPLCLVLGTRDPENCKSQVGYRFGKLVKWKGVRYSRNRIPQEPPIHALDGNPCLYTHPSTSIY